MSDEVKRGPGRPPKVQPQDVAPQQEPAAPQQSAAGIAAKRRKDHRAKRDALGALPGQRLATPSRPGYHRRWVNDDKLRLDDVKNLGYSHVTKERDEDKVILSSGQGDVISQTVGTLEGGAPLTAYLMEIPQEFRDEDQQEKEDRRRATEAQISDAMAGGDQSLGSGSTTYNPSPGANNLLTEE